MTTRWASGIRPYLEAAPLAALFLGISSGFAFPARIAGAVPPQEANVHVGGYFTTHSAGLSLTGRF